MKVIKANASAVMRAVRLSMVAIVILVIAAGVAIVASSDKVMRRELQNVNATDLAVLVALHRENGLDALIETVEAATRAPLGYRQLIGLFAADGSFLAGDLPTLPVPDRDNDVDVPRVSDVVNVSYIIQTKPLPDAVLLIGRPITIIQQTLRNLWVILPLFAVALMGTLIATFGFASRILGRQLDRFEHTLDDFGRGDLAARVPLGPDTDDRFYDVSIGINRNLEQIVATNAALENTKVAIAHDLRTPLTRASLALQDITVSEKLSEQATGRIETAVSELAVLGRTFDAILRLSNINAKQNRDSFAIVDLRALVAEVVESYAPVLEDAGYLLDDVATGGPADIWADKSLILQMLVNLLTNTIKHCPVGSKATITIATAADSVTLAVSDTGPGVAGDMLAAIFQPFVRMDPSRRQEGTGLGLALVKAVADHHNAVVHAENTHPGLRVAVMFRRADPSL